MTVSTRHCWGVRVECGPYKSEKTCTRCGVVRASIHQNEGARDVNWKEFWRGLDRIDGGDSKTPPCDARLERALERENLPNLAGAEA